MRIVLLGLSTALVLAAPTAARQPHGCTLRGSVTDENGEPRSAIQINAYAAAADGGMRQPQQDTFRCRTDDRGTFTLALPYGAVLYHVTAANPGGSHVTKQVIGSDNCEVAFRFESVGGPVHKHKGRLLDQSGKAVPDTEVTLVAEYGWSYSSRTDQQGTYAFTLPSYIGQGVLVARTDGGIVRSGIVRADRLVDELRLTEPARIVGRVTYPITDKPVAGATVKIGARCANDFRMEAKTGADGRYEIADVPPGEYWIYPYHDAFFGPDARGNLGLDVVATTGQTTTLDMHMDPAAVIEGTVFDRNKRAVPGAMVATPFNNKGINPESQWRLVWTDDGGRYRITSALLGRETQIFFFHGRQGHDIVKVQVPDGGDTIRDMDASLPGTARISGVIQDSDGKALANVRCLLDQMTNVCFDSDDSGGFDFGRVSVLPPDEVESGSDYSISTRCRRPDPGGFTYPHEHPGRPLAAQYHQNERLRLQPRPDKDVELTLKLEPAELVTIAVRVVDQAGIGIEGVSVGLFGGKVDEKIWVEYQMSTTEAFRSNRGIRFPNAHLADGATDASGRFKLQVVRENAGSMAILYGPRADWRTYSVGAFISEDRHAIENNIIVLPDRTETEVILRVDMPGRQTEAATLDG